MIKIHDNFISSDELNWFHQDMLQRIENGQYIKRLLPAPEFAQKSYGCTDTDGVMEYRVVLEDNDPARERLHNYISPLFPIKSYYTAYQRQFYPQQLHGDYLLPGTDLTNAYSIVIPLEENINGIFKTVCWKQQVFDDNDILDLLTEYRDKDHLKIYNNSKEYDLEHVSWYASSIIDSLELDGVYTYKLGTAVQFHRSQMHCSSNWKKYNLCNHKDFIIIHAN